MSLDKFFRELGQNSIWKTSFIDNAQSTSIDVSIDDHHLIIGREDGWKNIVPKQLFPLQGQASSAGALQCVALSLL